MELISNEFNKALNDPGLYEQFKKLKLTNEAQKLISENPSPQGETLQRSNGMLLQEVYSQEILKKEDTFVNPTILEADVATYWKKYDANTMTSFVEGDMNRASRLRNTIFFGLTRPELFSSRYTNRAKYKNIKVKSTNEYQTGLRPELTSLSWRLIGQKSVIISAQGNNFFSGTQVVIGDKAYNSPADGLVIKSNEAFDLATALDSLVSGTGSIIGRYGSAIPLISKIAPPNYGLTITGYELSPATAGNRYLKLKLSPSPLRLPSEKTWGKPVISIDGNLVFPPYDVDPIAGTLGANVPAPLLGKGVGLVRVSYPFLSAHWTAVFLISAPALDFEITRLSSKNILLHTNNFLGFTKSPETGRVPAPQTTDFCWRVFSGNNRPIFLRTEYCKESMSSSQQPNTGSAAATESQANKPARKKSLTPISARLGATREPTAMRLSDSSFLITSESDIPDRIVVVQPNGAVIPLDVPKSSQPAAEPPKPIELKQYDSVWIEVPIKDASKVASVEANQLTLHYQIPPNDDEGNPPKSIKVQVTRDLTARPGTVDLTVFDKDSKPINVIRLHISSVGGKEKHE